MVLEKLNTDVLLGISWIKEANAILNAIEKVESADGKNLKFKPYPEPVLLIVKEWVRVYSHKLIVLPPIKSVGVLVRQQAVNRKLWINK